MKKKEIFITNSAKQTQKLGKMLAEKLRGGPASTRETSPLVGRGGEILCLTGELGSGKTTFAQGVLKGLGVKGPYTSPTFVVMKKYHITHNTKHTTRRKKMLRVTSYELRDIYHIDCYRVKPQDIIELGWEEIISEKNNIVIIEWAEKIRSIVPKDAIWIKFEHVDKGKRRIVVGNMVIGGGTGH